MSNNFYKYRLTNNMTNKIEYTNIVPNEIKESELKCDEYTGYKDSKGNPIYDNDLLVNNELKEDAFVIKQTEKVVVLLRNSVIDILDNNKSSKWFIAGTIYDLEKNMWSRDMLFIVGMRMINHL